jgi:hypothetical protein
VQVTDVQPRHESAKWESIFATSLGDAHPVRPAQTAVGRPCSTGDGAVPSMGSEVSLGRVVRRGDIRASASQSPEIMLRTVKA